MGLKPRRQARGRDENEFPQRVKDRLALRAGGICSNPDCEAPTLGPSDEGPEALVNCGVAAHIAGAAPGSRHYDANMTPEERRSISNGIWLCGKCERLVDRDEVTYPAALLHEWKAERHRRQKDTLAGRIAAEDATQLEFVAAQVRAATNADTSADELAAILPVAAAPTMEGNVDLQVNAFYTEHYAGAVVIARVGNPGSEEITITDVELRVADVGTLIPQRMHGGLFVEGYDWCDAAPQRLPARGFRKLAWYFYSGDLHDRITQGTQPVPAHLSLELYPPTGAVSADLELYTLARIRELAGEAVDA